MFWKKPLPAPELPNFIPPSVEKIDFHIKRFSLALEQCEKGDTRKYQLQSNLRYWQTLKDITSMERT